MPDYTRGLAIHLTKFDKLSNPRTYFQNPLLIFNREISSSKQYAALEVKSFPLLAQHWRWDNAGVETAPGYFQYDDASSFFSVGAAAILLGCFFTGAFYGIISAERILYASPFYGDAVMPRAIRSKRSLSLPLPWAIIPYMREAITALRITAGMIPVYTALFQT